MDIIERLRQRLQGRSVAELRSFAERAGVNYHTLRKVVSGETQEPRYRFVERVRRHLPRYRRT